MTLQDESRPDIPSHLQKQAVPQSTTITCKRLVFIVTPNVKYSFSDIFRPFFTVIVNLDISQTIFNAF